MLTYGERVICPGPAEASGVRAAMPPAPATTVRALWDRLQRALWRFSSRGARVRAAPLALHRLWDDPAAPGYAVAWAAFQETSGLIPADPSGGDLHRLRLVDATIWGLGASERLLFARCGSPPSPNLSGVQADLMRRLHPAAAPRHA